MKHPLFKQVLIFLLLFGILYGGLDAWIGLTIPGGKFDSPWLAKHADFPSLLRYSLLRSAGGLLDLLNIDTYILDSYHLRVVNGRGVRMVYSCMGLGIMSFWAAFAAAFAVGKKHGLIWVVFGLLVIWSVNVIRVASLVLATNRDWPMPFNLDHHTWFNIAVYSCIGIMIYFYDKHARKLLDKNG